MENKPNMEVLIINQQEVRQLLSMGDCIDLMGQALEALGRGQGLNPLRPVLWLPDKRGALGMMPGYLGDIEAMGIKVISVFPGNHGTQYDSHQGAVMLFETQHGRLLALVDASEVTAIRTAATSGLATRLLARPEARNLAILGSGVQARTHLEAMLAVRPVEQVRVWSRDPENARDFARAAFDQHGLKIEVMSSVETAVDGADIVCTTTAAPDPILLGEQLGPGMHINAVGSSVPFTRELDSAAVAASRLFVDRRESTVNEAGDFLLAVQDGAIDESHILADLGEILLGQHPGRENAEEITLFKSLGLAVEDVASAYAIYQAALDQGLGVSVELGGGRD
jgi:ornithine cyclodeaminase/alanine dehydrogenase-like protein (mu-crystallin family)